MPSKKNYSVDGASARDIDELLRSHATEEPAGAASNESEVNNPYVNYFFFASAAVALPLFLFTTPIIQMSPIDYAVHFALSSFAAVTFLIMCYTEVSGKILKGLKRTKKMGAQSIAATDLLAANSAVFHVNAVYLVTSLFLALYLLPLYGLSLISILTGSVAGSAGLLLLLSKVF